MTFGQSMPAYFAGFDRAVLGIAGVYLVTEVARLKNRLFPHFMLSDFHSVDSMFLGYLMDAKDAGRRYLIPRDVFRFNFNIRPMCSIVNAVLH